MLYSRCCICCVVAYSPCIHKHGLSIILSWHYDKLEIWGCVTAGPSQWHIPGPILDQRFQRWPRIGPTRHTEASELSPRNGEAGSQLMMLVMFGPHYIALYGKTQIQQNPRVCPENGGRRATSGTDQRAEKKAGYLRRPIWWICCLSRNYPALGWFLIALHARPAWPPPFHV